MSLGRNSPLHICPVEIGLKSSKFFFVATLQLIFVSVSSLTVVPSSLSVAKPQHFRRDVHHPAHTTAKSAKPGTGSSKDSCKSAPCSLRIALATAFCRLMDNIPHQRCCSPSAVPLRTRGCSNRDRSRTRAFIRLIHGWPHRPYTSHPRQNKAPRPESTTG